MLVWNNLEKDIILVLFWIKRIVEIQTDPKMWKNEPDIYCCDMNSDAAFKININILSFYFLVCKKQLKSLTAALWLQ